MNKKNTPINNLNLSVRAYNILCRAGFSSAEEVASCTEEELMSIRYFSEKCLANIKEKLGELGLVLSEKSTGVLDALNNKKLKDSSSKPNNYNLPAVAAECMEVILRNDELRSRFFMIAETYELPIAVLISKLKKIVWQNRLYEAPKTTEDYDSLLNIVDSTASDIREKLDIANEEYPSLTKSDFFSRCDMLY